MLYFMFSREIIQMTNIAVFASGRGTNFNNLIKAQQAGLFDANIALLVAAKEGIGAIDTAKLYHIPYYIFPGGQSSLIPVLKQYQIDFIALAGWLKYISDDLLTVFPQRIINIHPALLPFFGGKGMYGMHVHRAVWKSGMLVSGATVHFVDEIYDHGAIIWQESTQLSPADTPEDIAQKVLKIEHMIFPKAIKRVLEKNFIISENRLRPKMTETT